MFIGLIEKQNYRRINIYLDSLSRRMCGILGEESLSNQIKSFNYWSKCDKNK